MIVTVTPNPAVDITYACDEVTLGATLRPRTTERRAGGKGVNVARVLHALGAPVLALGVAGGTAGEQITADLTASGIEHRFSPIGSESRSTVTLLSTADGSATIVNEHGPALREPEWAALLNSVQAALDAASVLVLSGSLPPGVPADGYAQLTRIGAAAGVPVILDSSGPALAAGLGAGPRLVKPNQDELAELAGTKDPLHAAQAVNRRYSCGVVASLGAEGLLAVDGDKAWRANSPETVHGNPIGAGDACVAALARNLAAGTGPERSLADAVALSAAAVRAPRAGDVDLEYYRTHRDEIAVRALNDPAVEDPALNDPALNDPAPEPRESTPCH